MSSDPFAEVLPLCRKSNELIQQVFTNPDLVMAKLVQNIFLTKLQVQVNMVYLLFLSLFRKKHL